MPYKFRLQSILNLREYKETQCKEELGRALVRLNQAEQLRDRILMIIDTSTSELQEISSSGKNLYLVEFYDHYIRYQNELLTRQLQVVADCRKALAYARMQLIEAMKERKILNKLDDKLRERYLFEMDKREQAQMDELATSRYLTLT